MDKYFFAVVRKLPYGNKIIDELSDMIMKYNAHNIALGFAIGVFWGVFPTFGIAFLLSFITAGFLNASKAAAVLGSFTTNPITSPFFIAVTLFISGKIGGVSYSPEIALNHLFEIGFRDALLNLTISYIISSLFFAIISYFIIYYFADKYYKIKLEKQIKKTYKIVE